MRRRAAAPREAMTGVAWCDGERRFLDPHAGSLQTAAMTVSRLRIAKSETRDMAERDRGSRFDLRLGEPAEWHMSNATFLAAFVAIAAVLAVLALVLRG